MKQTTSTSRSSSGTAQRRGRRLVQYLLVLVGIVLLLDALVGEKGLLETRKKQREQATIDRAINRLQAENRRLRDEIGLLTNDPATIEAHARRDLGLMKPGEKLFIVREVAPAD